MNTEGVFQRIILYIIKPSKDENEWRTRCNGKYYICLIISIKKQKNFTYR